MNTQELWQSQALDAPRVSLAYVQHRARDLKRRTQIRNSLEYGAAVLFTPVFAWVAWKILPRFPIMSVGLMLTVLATLYIAIRWHQLASTAEPTASAEVLDTLSAYRRELERQRDARRGSWRRWLPPSLPGILLIYGYMFFETNWFPRANTAISATFAVLWVSLSVMFQEWSARRLQREIDALDSLTATDTVC